MLVSDIFNDAQEVLGMVNQTTVFGRITDAIEALANKGPWEPLLAYCVIPTTNSVYVTLPSSIEVPIRVNLNGNPAFARDKLYEFTLNGPGSNATRVDWSWEDQMETATVDPVTGVVTRPPTPQRTIRISQSGVAVRMLCRLRTTAITAMTQFIPLNSKLAILLMLKALESFRRGTPVDFELGQMQEQQALKFLQEEQATRNLFSDISKQVDLPPIYGYQMLHVKNMIVVSDIYDEAAAICGGIGQQHVLDMIGEAVEVLANKSQWDSMTAYLDILTTSTQGSSGVGGTLVGLPRQVEIPLRININTKPSLPRSRMFEFSLNGPGTNMPEVTSFSWVDQGFSPVITTSPLPGAFQVNGYTQDNGVTVTIYGHDTSGNEVSAPLYLQGGRHPLPPIGNPQIFADVTRIVKPVTAMPVDLYVNSVLVAHMYPDETSPNYRMIKLSSPASEVKIMFRKDNLRLTSTLDFIPLTSRRAILLTLKALQIFKAPNLNAEQMALAQQLEAQALKFLQEEEQSKLGFIEASSKDQLPALAVTTHARNVVLVGEVYDEACDIFGQVGRDKIMDAISDAMEYLANKSQWDGLEGYIDVTADQTGYVTLPSPIETVIGVNFWKQPAQMRNRWYEFNLDGYGGTSDVFGYYWDDLGEYPLAIEPTIPSQLVCFTNYLPDSTPPTSTPTVVAYGYDQFGNWIRSIVNGVEVDGETVPVIYVAPNQSIQLLQAYPGTNNTFAQVSRISKAITNLPIQLNAFNQPNTATPPTYQWLASYQSYETEPMYRRIRIPKWVTWVRIRFRKSTLKVSQMTDPLNLKSKTAIIMAMKSLKALRDGDLQAAEGFEKKAVQLISEEQMSRNPNGTFQLEFDPLTCWADPLQGRVI